MKKLKGRRFLISGGAGFIGSNTCEFLLGKGAHVLVYDNLSSGNYALIKQFTKNKNFHFVKKDLLNTNELKRAFKDYRPQAVIHLAANPDVKAGMKNTKLDLMQGFMTTYNLLEVGRVYDVEDFIFSSSSTVYGYADVKPTPEEYGPLKPVSLYGAAKAASESNIAAFSDLYGFNSYIFRFANVVGRNMTHGVIFDFIHKLNKDKRHLHALGDGNQKKSYMDVLDCVQAIMYVYAKAKDKQNIYNLATDDQVSVREIAEMVVSMVSKNAQITYSKSKEGWPGDITDSFLSNKKLKALGYKLLYKKSSDAVRNAIHECSAGSTRGKL